MNYNKRFLLLYSFLERMKKKKVIVFFSSCACVKYHSDLLNFIDTPVLDLHVSRGHCLPFVAFGANTVEQGKQKQQKRTNTFFEFINAESGILLCTDVAARGLDIPRVDWIIQYDPPDDPRDYIHRVGRTARAGKVGKSLLFLLCSELGFLRFLKESKVPLNEYSFPANKIANVQSQVRMGDLYSAKQVLTPSCSSRNCCRRTTSCTSLRRMAIGRTCRHTRRIHLRRSSTSTRSIWPRLGRRSASRCHHG